MILVPPDRLGADILTALIEEFILQEGTDYGRYETALANKTEQVRRQIDKGEVFITYDEQTESCNLLTKREYQRYQDSLV
ncbi:MAG: YheU family protein [Gammaproteobacteria bacterium]|nr:MAG: YheU family protein [Gammaproteobacteria bacterium]RLA53381.1 MAG: YheU family protein [Gammaproteobacteria bacterium]